jgi:hypothetical protein
MYGKANLKTGLFMGKAFSYRGRKAVDSNIMAVFLMEISMARELVGKIIFNI